MPRPKSEMTTKQNQERLLRRVMGAVSQKYTPDLHIPLPIAEFFEGLGRTKELFYTFKKELPELVRSRGYIERNKTKEVAEVRQKKLIAHLDSLIETITRVPNSGISSLPIHQLGRMVREIDEQIHKLLSLISTAERKEEASGRPRDPYSTPYRSETNDLFRLLNHTYALRKFLSSDSAKCANNPLLLLTGEAGTGKTHLLCAIAEERIQKNLPTFVFLAEEINTRDPWESLLKEIGATGGEDKFLRGLSEFAARKKVRALIIIDAINEAPRRVTWERLMKVRQYPWVGLVLSVRNGFEDEYTTQAIRKSFVRVEHKGFALREWEAVTKYFNQYGIPLPEIPLLLPDFSNPLFLTIFCKTHKGGKKHIKGHAGFTTIFEDYVMQQGDEVLSSFGLPAGRIRGKHSIWDFVFKDIAMSMSKANSERISTAKAEAIITKYFSTVNPTLFLRALEKHFLLFRIPHYDGNYKIHGYDYKFPYQKFSDHLIVRYLLIEHLNMLCPESSFKVGTPLGDILRASWPDYGIIEALSIQVPEWLKGRELIFLAPAKFRATDTAKRAFLASLIWRKLAIKDGKSQTIKSRLVIDYFNKYLIHTHSDELKNTLIATATIPYHPFNAHFLHKHLSGMKMPTRDSSWLPFLHRHYATYSEDSSIDRIIYWSWKRSNLFPLSNESIRLTAIPLAWFLASSNRYLRDRSTKALVALLEKHIDILIELLKSFESIDDPYILERLYAVAYGCAMRSPDKDAVSRLALYTYETIFAKGNPPVHIILRDHARGVVETGLIRNPQLQINKKLIDPPYSSRWPKTIPSVKYLQEKYFSQKIKNRFGKEIRAYGQIWHSLMYGSHGGLGDFGNYVVGLAVGHWADVPTNREDRPPTRKEMYKAFLGSLTPAQFLRWRLYQGARYRHYKSRPMWAILTYIQNLEGEDKEKHEKELKKISAREKLVEARRKEFVKELSLKQNKIYEDWIGPYQDRNPHRPRDLDRQAIERLIFSTIIRLGWNPKLFADFDNSIDSHGRDAKKSERIGKKYQWIAFHEVLARIADNYAFKANWSDELKDYKGVWQFWDRDLDPSVLWNEPVRKYGEDEKHHISYTNWQPSLTSTKWLQTRDDLPPQSGTLQVKDGAGKNWLVLKRSYTWKQPDVPGQEEYKNLRREVWYVTQAYLVPRKDSAAFFAWAKKQDFMGSWMPKGFKVRKVYLREFPYHLAYRDLYNVDSKEFRWREVRNGIRSDEKTKFKVVPTNEEYSSEFSGFDCSSDESFSLMIPSKEICELLGLTFSDEDGVYLQGNEIVAFDPIVLGQAQGLVVEKAKLQEALADKDLELFWVVVGEKRILGEIGNSVGWVEIGGVHWLKSDGRISSHVYSKYLPPQ